MTDACGNYKTNYTADVINLKAFLVSNRNKMQEFFVLFSTYTKWQLDNCRRISMPLAGQSSL
jgi:hypothetical protein